MEVDSGKVLRFAEVMSGEVLRPEDAGYDEARAVWNALVDKRPALIARCTSAADVVECVRFARANDVEFSVRGGGHNIAGSAVSDGGLMIDLSKMKDAEVDVRGRRVRAQPGLKLGEFDAATQAVGLATTMGVAADTGIAGLTLGGGYGWLASKYGLACDSLTSVDVVTSDANVITASEDEHPDLFWAVRGGGGNFGIVTSFNYALYPLGPVVGGLVIYQRSRDVIRFFDEFSRGAPDEVSTVGLLLTAPDGTPAFAVACCHCGEPRDAERVLAPLREFGPPLADMIETRPYVQMQQITDDAWPPGRLYYWKSSLVRSIGDELADTMLDCAERLPTPYSVMFMQQLHGAAARIDPTATAFPHRFDHFDCGAMLEADDGAVVDSGIAWARDSWQAMQPYAERSNYVNDLGDEGTERVREAYGPNYDRLVSVKRAYDPTNFFRGNQNIPPS